MSIWKSLMVLFREEQRAVMALRNQAGLIGLLTRPLRIISK